MSTSEPERPEPSRPLSEQVARRASRSDPLALDAALMRVRRAIAEARRADHYAMPGMLRGTVTVATSDLEEIIAATERLSTSKITEILTKAIRQAPLTRGRRL